MLVFAVDMDGTFLNNNNDYNRVYFNDILREYGEAFKFVVASSNTVSHLQSFFEDDDIYYVGSNGAVIMHKGEVLNTQYVDSYDVESALALLREQAISTFVVSTLNASYVNQSATDVFIERMQRYYNDLIVSDIIDVALVTKITIDISASNEEIKAIIDALNTALKHSIAVDSGFNCIDIINENTNKAVAISKVLDMIGATVNHLYTFGDSDNDIEMLAMTKHSYAMANANDRVKAIANHICLSNEQDGVLKTIESILKKEL